MLSSLLIENLALIEKLNIDFNGGLNILTGETGAGKSILIGAVQLLSGKRADKSIIRHGASQCSIQAIYELGALEERLGKINELLEESGVV